MVFQRRLFGLPIRMGQVQRGLQVQLFSLNFDPNAGLRPRELKVTKGGAYAA